MNIPIMYKKPKYWITPLTLFTTSEITSLRLITPTWESSSNIIPKSLLKIQNKLYLSHFTTDTNYKTTMISGIANFSNLSCKKMARRIIDLNK